MAEEVVLQPDDSVLAVIDPNKGNQLAEALEEAFNKAKLEQEVNEDG